MPTPTINVTLRRHPEEPTLLLEAEFPGTEAFTAQLPIWRPGRYEAGQFAQYVYGVEGQLADKSWSRLEKSSLHAWQVPAGCSRLRWSFRADMLNAGSTCIEPGLLYVNPVNCFLYDPLRQDLGFTIKLADIPGDWPVATALPVQYNSGTVLCARDVQHVMDSPFFATPHPWHRQFEIDGVQFHLWAYGENIPSEQRFVEDHVKFTKAQLAHFGSFPAEAYHFLYLFPERESRHGVEHEDSTVISLGPSAKCLTEAGYNELVGIASHELYHTWNVKRIRPAEWMPYDFSREAPSRLGYVAEGVTTYMGDLFLFEAGCVDLAGWCGLMEKLLDRHVNNPGRLNMSVAESSYDTWLDGYRPGIPGRKGSIYVEGAVLAFLCDVRIMELTGGKASLQTAITALWESHGKPRKGLTADAYWKVLNDIAGAPDALNVLRAKYCEGVEDAWDDLVAGMSSQKITLTKTQHKKKWRVKAEPTIIA